MKKLNLLIAALVSVSLMGGLVACQKPEENKEKATEQTQAPAPKVEETTPAAPTSEQAAPATPAAPEAPKTK